MATLLKTHRSSKLKAISEQVIVITGASSGIGLETALLAGKAGARVVLAARNGHALDQAVERINDAGGQAIAVITDVSRREDLEQLAQAAIDKFGRIDTWVNNAGIEIWGLLEEGDPDESRRLFDVNFWGLVDGSLVAVEHLKVQGGALINIGSVESDRAFPLQGIYAASKHAVKGFTDALRMELEKAGTPISVTLIKPASIATPLPQNAVNDMDKEIQLPPPLYKPEEVALSILHAAEHPVRDVMVGGSGRIMSALGKFAPRVMDKISEAFFFDAQQRDQPLGPPGDNFDRPFVGGIVEGRHPGQRAKMSLYTKARLHPVVAGSILAGLGLIVLSLRKR